MLMELEMLLLSFSYGKVQFSVAARRQTGHALQAVGCEGTGSLAGWGEHSLQGRVWSNCNFLCPKVFAYPSAIRGQLAQKS